MNTIKISKVDTEGQVGWLGVGGDVHRTPRPHSSKVSPAEVGQKQAETGPQHLQIEGPPYPDTQQARSDKKRVEHSPQVSQHSQQHEDKRQRQAASQSSEKGGALGGG